MKAFSSAWRSHPLLILSIFGIGVLTGILVGRASSHSFWGDVLTALSLIVVGLTSGVILYLAGNAYARERPASDETAEGAPALTGLPTAPTPLPAAQTVEARPEAIVREVTGETRAPGEWVESEADEGEEPHAPDQAISLGRHLVLGESKGRRFLELRDLFGYESLALTLGWNSSWMKQASSSQPSKPLMTRLRELPAEPGRLALVLFAASLLIYAFTRLFALSQYPINFFADEANQVLNGVDLAKRGFRDTDGEILPVYIRLFSFYYPDISVYLHAVTASLFGVSIQVARATTALLSIPLAIGLGLLMKEVFRARYWWSVVLLLAMTPFWLLWSRTAFDPAAMACLYGLTVVFYLLYRYRSPVYLYPAVVLGAATFYAYPSGQPAIGVLVLLLLISDWRYHWQNRQMFIWLAPLLLILAIPFFRFVLEHPDETDSHLRTVNSYLLQDIPLLDKIGQGASIYLRILNPAYWFLPGQPDLVRHELKGYGFLPLLELPLLIAGVILCVSNFRESKYRAALAALLAAPVGAAVTDPAIIRELAVIGPSAIVSALGLEWLLSRVKKPRAIAAAQVGAFGFLALLTFGLFADALTNGPTWSSDYTLYGMQWGAEQVFQDEIPQLVRQNPGVPIYVSDTWANGTDVFMRFFNTDRTQVQMASINGWLKSKLPLDWRTIFVMTPDEYSKAAKSPKFKNLTAMDTIKYPDGRDGFYIAHLEYADNVDQVFAAERTAELQPITETVIIQGQPVAISHTKLDIGNAQNMFDGNPYTVARGVEANPFHLELQFPEPRAIQSLTGIFGKSDTQVSVLLYGPDSDQPVAYEKVFAFASASTTDSPKLADNIDFDHGPALVSRISMEFQALHTDDHAHVHVFELEFH